MMIRSRETPINVAVVGSCATARMPRPNFVRLMAMSVRIATTSAAPMTTRVTLVMIASNFVPSNKVNWTAGFTRTMGCCALLPPYPFSSFGNTKCTNSCRTNDMPIAVMRKVRARAFRLRSGR
ncbi:Uncharacterised protein [Mycolicibacterium fortuitum]|uniref:Uncharacterized protein n=1 Tax=Mycolicibacterium fortuitum TaxID=1766 RepID=A0A378UBQ1_MYCFO|nr:Uncharacterised protein [Mycolicibacterium fortuitum]